MPKPRRGGNAPLASAGGGKFNTPYWERIRARAAARKAEEVRRATTSSGIADEIEERFPQVADIQKATANDRSRTPILRIVVEGETNIPNGAALKAIPGIKDIVNIEGELDLSWVDVTLNDNVKWDF